MSIAKNYFYDLILQISGIVIPFITIPYVTRVLDPQGVGIVSFTGSIVQYFTLFAALGMSLYGSRTIAYIRNDTEKINESFWELFYIKLFTSMLTMIVYFIFVSTISSKYKIVYYVQSLSILAVAFDISYFFTGIEDFKKVSLRSLVIKIVSAAAIFLFVKSQSDYVLYAIISVLGTLISQVVLWAYLPDYIRIKKITHANLKEHLFGMFKLFVPMVAVEVYTVLDKTMIGLINNEAEVAYYDYAQRIVKMSLTLITSLGTVMIPRVSNLISGGYKDQVDGYAKKVFDFYTYSSVFLMVAFLVTMPTFVPMFFGQKFLKVKDLIMVISPILLFISWSNLFGMQLFVPFKLENFLTLSVVIGAVVNFSLNMLLIPKYNSYGASIASVIAEFCVTLVQLLVVRKLIDVRYLFKGNWKHFISGFVTFLSVYFITINLKINLISKLVAQLVLLVLVYLGMEFLLKSDINLDVVNKALTTIKLRPIRK
ncbi:MAG TPA: flippase [Fervidobacterium sp.]|nr:flippase [Fervidobacterium sp.]